jgi:hypothetical protein
MGFSKSYIEERIETMPHCKKLKKVCNKYRSEEKASYLIKN